MFKQGMALFRQKILAVTIGIMLLITALFYLQLAIASLLVTRPSMAIVDLERKSSNQNSEQIKLQLSRVEMAIDLFPQNAGFYSLAGRFQRLLNEKNHQEADVDQAARYFAKAVELEPTAYKHKTWQAWYLYQQFGWTSEISHTLDTALVSGKYEVMSQKLLLPIALANWQKLSAASKYGTKQMLNNMFLLRNTHFSTFAVKTAQKYCVVGQLAEHAQNNDQTKLIQSALLRQQGCA